MTHLLDNSGDIEVAKQALIPDLAFVKQLYYRLTAEGRGRLRELVNSGRGLAREVRVALSCGLLSKESDLAIVESLIGELEEGGLDVEEGELQAVIFTVLNNKVSCLAGECNWCLTVMIHC